MVFFFFSFLLKLRRAFVLNRIWEKASDIFVA